MQQIEHEEKQPSAPANPQSQPFHSLAIAQVNGNDDDPDEIFLRAVAEIDTQPLPKRTRTVAVTLADMCEVLFLVSVLCLGMFGIVWQCLTYPHTLVVVYVKAKPAAITTILDVATRTLAPVTITRSVTGPTTGTGHQDAKAATGTLMFYNGSTTPQFVPPGSVFTGNDGVKVTIAQSISVPAANLPVIGRMPVIASALLPGSQGNIPAFDINVALSSVLKVRNEAPFSNGQNARSYKTVASPDLTTLTSTVNGIVMQAFTTAFSIQQDEQEIPTKCHTTTTPNHQIGQEATSVTVTTVKTCSAVVYSRQQLARQAAVAFAHTRPAVPYHLVGSIQMTLKSVTPLSANGGGKWAYTFTPAYEQYLAEKIAGDTPAQARKALLHTGIVAYASVPMILPPAMYITFLVLEG